MSKKAVILLSGGIDSSVLAYLYKNKGYELTALSFSIKEPRDNGSEINSANKIAKILDMKHTVIDISFINSILSNFENKSAEKHEEESIDRKKIAVPLGVEIMLLSVCLYAVSNKINILLWGIQSEDFKGRAKANPKLIESYLDKFYELINFRNKMEVIIETPFLEFTKEQIVDIGFKLNMPFESTFSCLITNGITHCGKCEQCKNRARALNSLGLNLSKKGGDKHELA